MTPLTDDNVAALVRRVFRLRPADQALAILVNLPDATVPDHPAWRWRRETALSWAAALRRVAPQPGMAVHVYAYPNVHRNNADLPAGARQCLEPDSFDPLGAEEPWGDILDAHPIVVSLTELSATAPLKLAARTHAFRAATMPGFSAAMVPALAIDYGVVNHRVDLLKKLLDQAALARLTFRVGAREHRLELDLRHRTGHASGGLFPEPGMVGNLPSGEAYIVPYEGERAGDPSRSAGELPVQLGDEVVLYRIEGNRAVSVAPGGAVARDEAALLAREPAYGNLAELGLGVLGDFGLQPTGEILLDEKLGLHLAFGRSDHFGGQVGAKDFSKPEAVVHLDRVYVPAMQPRVHLAAADLVREDGGTVPLFRDDRWVLDFTAA